MATVGIRMMTMAAFGLFAIACAAPAAESETEDGAQAQTSSSAALGFLCECKAVRPGVENAKGIKECSYACDCDTLHPDAIKKAGRVEVGPMESQAFSWESWDSGSRICHGQYSYKPTLSSPNWQIQVKFSSFKLNHLGYVSYANAGESRGDGETTVTERVTSSTNVTEEIRRTAKAPEVRDALAKKLGVRLPE